MRLALLLVGVAGTGAFTLPQARTAPVRAVAGTGAFTLPPARPGTPALARAATLPRTRASVVAAARFPSWRDELAAPVNSLLCQRASQTLIYYALEFKNDLEKSWLLRFSEEHGVPPLCTHGGRMLHSHDAFEAADVRWDEWLHAMLRRPDETHEVAVVWGNRVSGGSPGNPYLQKKAQATTYVDTLSPQVRYLCIYIYTHI